MTSPRALLLSIAATVCGFNITLVAAAGQASIAPTPVGGAALAPGIVSTVAQDVSHVDPITFMVAQEPAASHPTP